MTKPLNPHHYITLSLLPSESDENGEPTPEGEADRLAAERALNGVLSEMANGPRALSFRAAWKDLLFILESEAFSSVGASDSEPREECFQALCAIYGETHNHSIDLYTPEDWARVDETMRAYGVNLPSKKDHLS